MATRIQLRRATAAVWTSVNPVLALGEPGFETDTGFQKVGDGVSAWAGLAYSASSPSVVSASPTTTKTLPVQPVPGFIYVLNVKDFGALGDGATDDTAAIANARLQAYQLIAGSGKIAILYFPQGDYIASTLTFKNSVGSNAGNICILMGDGKNGTRLKLKAATNAPLLDIGGTLAGESLTFVSVRDMTVDGNKANQTVAAPLVRFRRVDRSTMRSVFVTNSIGDGIYCQSSALDFDNCESTSNTGNGLWFDSCVSGIARDSFFNFNGGHGVRVDWSNDLQALSDAGGSGYVVVERNHYENNVNGDVYAANTDNVHVDDNVHGSPVGSGRVDSCGTTSGSPVVTDTSVVDSDSGRKVTGAGVPTNTYVGTVIAGVSFRLSSSPFMQTDVNATATSGAVNLTLALPPIIEFAGVCRWGTITRNTFTWLGDIATYENATGAATENAYIKLGPATYENVHSNNAAHPAGGRDGSGVAYYIDKPANVFDYGRNYSQNPARFQLQQFDQDAVSAGLAGFVTNRRYFNDLLWSEDLTNAAWTATSLAVVNNTDVHNPADPISGLASKLTFSAYPAHIEQSASMTEDRALAAGDTITFAIWMRVFSDSGRPMDTQLRLLDSTGALLNRRDFQLTSSWRRYAVSYTIPAAVPGDGVHVSAQIFQAGNVSAGAIYVWGGMLARGDVGPYIPTTTAQHVASPGVVAYAGKFSGPVAFAGPLVNTLTDQASIATDASLGNYFTVTLAGNRTMANPTGAVKDGQTLTYRITQDGTGSRTITWDTQFRFSTDVPSPTLSTTAAKTDYVTFRYNAAASTWDCLGVVRGY